jgi:hypothetical protein
LKRWFQLCACVLKPFAVRKINFGRDGLRAHNGNDPTRRLARCIFLHRPNQTRDGRPHQVQRSLMALELGKTSAPGFFRIGDFN